jgi:hypothetical protein
MSRANRPQTAIARENFDDLKSQKSVGSRVSKVSSIRPMSHYGAQSKKSKTASIAMSVGRADTDSSVDEDDEWAAIQKFQALMHYEEQK